jgi:predicted negative regulator of RcsB-dependent stress response
MILTNNSINNYNIKKIFKKNVKYIKKILILLSIGMMNWDNIKQSLPAQIRGNSNYVQHIEEK